MVGATALGVLVLMSCATWASATDHIVGDSKGWELQTDYSTWASGKTFVVGDNLVFKYLTPQHNVEEVSASAYSSCSSSNAISSDNNGTTTIPLKTIGKHYFICGIDGHCNSGMKLEIEVIYLTTPAPPSGNNYAAGRPSPAHATMVLVGLMVLKHIF